MVPPPMTRTIHSKAEQVPGAIVAGVTRVIARRGVDGATLDRMARETGVLISTIIYHFRSKRGVLAEICRRHMALLLSVVEQADQPEVTARHRLDAMAAALVEAIAGASAAHDAMLQAGGRLAAGDARDLRQQQRWLVALFVEAAEAVVPALRQRADLAKPAVLSLLILLTHHAEWFREDGAMSRAAYARFAVSSMLGGIRHGLRATRAGHLERADRRRNRREA